MEETSDHASLAALRVEMSSKWERVTETGVTPVQLQEFLNSGHVSFPGRFSSRTPQRQKEPIILSDEWTPKECAKDPVHTQQKQKNKATSSTNAKIPAENKPNKNVRVIKAKGAKVGAVKTDNGIVTENKWIQDGV